MLSTWKTQKVHIPSTEKIILLVTMHLNLIFLVVVEKNYLLAVYAPDSDQIYLQGSMLTQVRNTHSSISGESFLPLSVLALLSLQL